MVTNRKLRTMLTYILEPYSKSYDNSTQNAYNINFHVTFWQWVLFWGGDFEDWENIFFITNHFKQAIKVLCIETIFVSSILCIRTMHNYIAFGFFVVHKLILFSIFFNFQHRIPKEYHDRDPRINLTFRVIYPK